MDTLDELIQFELTASGVQYLKNTTDKSNLYDLISLYEKEGVYKMNGHMFGYFFSFTGDLKLIYDYVKNMSHVRDDY